MSSEQLSVNQPIDLGCESAENWQLPSTSTIATVIITQPVGWYSFYCPEKGGTMMSRRRHCSKGAQPVPKAVYRSGCHDKHNRPRYDSNLGPVTPQSNAHAPLTTRFRLKSNPDLRKSGRITKAAMLPFAHWHLLGAANGRKLFLKIHVKIQIV